MTSQQFTIYLYLIGLICSLLIAFTPAINAQALIDSKGDTDGLFDQFGEDRFQDIEDKELMKREFKKKQQLYNSLITKKSPIYFKADHQEINEKERTYFLSGEVSIRKDKFKLLADRVNLNQWTGKLEAWGNVEIHFGDDLLTGSECMYNFDTGQGWIRNARAAVEPSLFLEGDLLEKLPDFHRTGDAQYALHNGYATSCAGDKPDWKIKTSYAVIRIENYAHMNKSSFWISKVPIFYSPYWFYPTKSDRATGLLIPNVSFNSRRGFIFSEEFFWVMNDRMDLTIGGTYYSKIGLAQNLEWRNAFDQYSQGELRVEHIKEDESPWEDENPQERWKGEYEQSYIFPWDVRGTVDMDFRSDEFFDRDYGYELEQEADRFMESRVSLTKYWTLAHITLDGVYEKDFDKFRDETLQHLPRFEYSTGLQTIWGDLKGSFTSTAEFITRESLFTTNYSEGSGTLRIEDWLDRNGYRIHLSPEIQWDYSNIAWFSFTPWIGVDETIWDTKKTFDPDYPEGSWATYADELPPEENSFLAGVYESGDWIRREIYRIGFDWVGPRFYKIFPLVGYNRVSKIKHLIEPELSLSIKPDVIQDQLIEFDDLDRQEGGRTLTYSITNRFLTKVHPPQRKPKDYGLGNVDEFSDGGDDTAKEKDATDSDKDASVDTVDMRETADADDMEEDAESDGTDKENTKSEREDRGQIREFGYFTISQSYDFLKDDEWDEREDDLTKTEERELYPLGNIKLDVTVNPFNNIYFSSRMEYDPFHDDFSTGYLYGHMKSNMWKFGVRWDYSKNFDYPLFDLHSLALEGGAYINEHWSFGAWVKYDFNQSYFPYANLDLTYTEQCWALTLHTYYENDRRGTGTSLDPFVDEHEIQFGISVTFKNIDSVGPRKFGRFWWGDEDR